MRFEIVAGLAAGLPDPLPAYAPSLMPVRIGGRTDEGPGERRNGASGGRRIETPGGRRALGHRPRPAAVLVLLHPDSNGETRTVLIERASHKGHHSGEVSFPGGKVEIGDDDRSATALREAAEEIGLDPVAAGVHIVGSLESFWIPVSDFHVTPILALADRSPTLRADPREVVRILRPRLDHFLPSAPIRLIEREIDGRELRYGTYDVDGLSVWGATARILSQLGSIVAAG